MNSHNSYLLSEGARRPWWTGPALGHLFFMRLGLSVPVHIWEASQTPPPPAPRGRVRHHPGRPASETWIPFKNLFSARFCVTCQFLTQAFQTDCTLQFPVGRYCFIGTEGQNGTENSKKLGEWTDTERKMLVPILHFYHIFTTWWEFSKTIFSVTFLVSWLKICLL